MNDFPCMGCGSCCRRISQVVNHYKVSSKNDVYYFPYKWDENGVCENLTEDNKCLVYDNRPLICNINACAKHHNLDMNDFHARNIRACNHLMDLDGLPLNLRINQ